MKRKLTFREQWEIAYRNHRIAEGVDTEGRYSSDDCQDPRFRQAIIRSAETDDMLCRWSGEPLEARYLTALAASKAIRVQNLIPIYKKWGIHGEIYVHGKPKEIPTKPMPFSLWPAPPVGVQK